MSDTTILHGQITNISKADCEPEEYEDDDFDAVELQALADSNCEYKTIEDEADVEIWHGGQCVGFGWAAPSGEGADGGFYFWVYLQEPSMTDGLWVSQELELRQPELDTAKGE